MTDGLIKQGSRNFLGGVLAATLIFASCGAPDAEESTETKAVDTTTEIETETTGTAAAEEDDGGAGEVVVAEGHVIVRNLDIEIPEGWASISEGDDIETALAEDTPEVFASLKAAGELELFKSTFADFEWVGVSPEGALVLIEFAERGQDPQMAANELAEGFEAGLESTGFGLKSKEDYSGRVCDS